MGSATGSGPLLNSPFTGMKYGHFQLSTHAQQARNGNFLNLIRNIHEKPTADTILNGEKLEALLLTSGMRHRSFQNCTGNPSSYSKIRKKIKEIQIGK